MIDERLIRCADGREKRIRLTRKLAIACHCTECMGFGDPKACTSPKCPLYGFRAKTLKTMRGDVEQTTKTRYF